MTVRPVSFSGITQFETCVRGGNATPQETYVREGDRSSERERGKIERLERCGRGRQRVWERAEGGGYEGVEEGTQSGVGGLDGLGIWSQALGNRNASIPRAIYEHIWAARPGVRMESMM